MVQHTGTGKNTASTSLLLVNIYGYWGYTPLLPALLSSTALLKYIKQDSPDKVALPF